MTATDETSAPVPAVEAATAAAPAPAPAPASAGGGVSIRAFICGILAFLTSWIAVFAWPFIILAIVFAIIGLRRRAQHRWMNITAIVLAVLGFLGTFVLPLLTIFVAYMMFGELDPAGVGEVFWHFWVGQYLFVS